MKDFKINDFNVFISDAEKKRYRDFEIAASQAAVFGGPVGCHGCGRMLLLKTEANLCENCVDEAVKMYIAINKLKYIE